MKQYVVLGLGIFGRSIVANLMKKPGVEVFAVDKDMHLVDDMKDIATQSIRLDSTNREALEAIEINKFDAVFVTIGQQNMMASILTSLLLKEMGVPYVIARYVNEQHRAILDRIGVDELLNPEEKMGEEIAKNIVSTNSIPYFELFEQYSIEEIQVGEKFVGKSVSDIDIKDKCQVHIMAVKKDVVEKDGDEQTEIGIIFDDRQLSEEDTIVAIGTDKEIAKFKKYCNS